MFCSKQSFKKKLKEILWPIDRSEMKLFLPLSIMMLSVLFNFGALRSIKDSLVVPNIGAESISFLKLWFVLPSTVLFTLIYIKISNIFSYEYVFYLIVSFFLGVFILFTYVIFPNPEIYHPSQELINSLVQKYPNFKWFFYIINKWSYALMYIFCELWSVVVINLLFWQYANHIFDTKSAKRFYPFLGVIGNLGLVLAGNVLVFYTKCSTDSAQVISDQDMVDQCGLVLRPIMNFIIFAGVLSMLMYYYIDRYLLKKYNFRSKFTHAEENTKTKLSFIESIKLVLNSKYIGHIVLLIVSYGLVINLLEGPWKASVRILYPNTIDYLNFMGRFNIYMGISCVTFMIIGSNILRHFSWRFSALVTPFMLLCTGSIFFTFFIFSNNQLIQNWSNPIYVAVIIGAIQNILSKSTKYSLFDSTKEMAYIPLSLELRTKGKAAAEVIGLKLGKSLGAFIQSTLFMFLPLATFDSVTNYLFFIFILGIMIWIWNINKLNKKYIKLQ